MILRSFSVRGDGRGLPREGSFVARVSEFLGLAARPDGFAILTVCDEPPRFRSSLLLPEGYVAPPWNGDPVWIFYVRVDNEPPPEGRQVRSIIPPSDSRPVQTGVLQPRYLGAVALGDGVAFVYVAPQQAPAGAEFVE